MQLVQTVKNFLADEEGVTAIEYGLIGALIAVVIVTTVTLVGEELDAIFARILAALQAA